MREKRPPVDRDVFPDRWSEPGYLLEEELRPEEIRLIEDRLPAAEPRTARPNRRRWLLGAAAALLLFVMAFIVRQNPTALRGTPPRESPPRATHNRAMVLEIVRTDIPNAKPYKLEIELDRPNRRDSEVKP